MIIRVSNAALVLLIAVIAACTTSKAQTPNSPTLNPIATPTLVARAVKTVGVPQTSLTTRTVEATPTILATATITTESVPDLAKEGLKSVPPNPTAPSTEGGLNEVVGAHLSVYNCIGDNGGYCPDASRTASGEKVAPGVAACDRTYLWKKFVISGDPTNTVWTCLDTGLFTSPLFDLWFYDLEVGRGYLNNLPVPYKVVFVD